VLESVKMLVWWVVGGWWLVLFLFFLFLKRQRQEKENERGMGKCFWPDYQLKIFRFCVGVLAFCFAFFFYVYSRNRIF